MSDTLVSVVIPAYNAEETLPSCLESVRKQNWQALQIIVVDDGSTDGTLAYLQRQAVEDPRVEVYHQSNKGVSEARNNALSHCRGEYIRFVDSDDWLPSDSIRIMVERALATGCDLVIAGYNEVIGPLCTPRNLEDRSDTVPMDLVLTRLNIYANSFFYGVLWNKLFRRSLIEAQQVRFISGVSWGEDFSFVMDFLHKAVTVSYMREIVYHYNRRVGGLTVKQALDCIIHPVENVRMKLTLYRRLKNLYICRGAYTSYRRTLWMYLIRFTLNQ